MTMRARRGPSKKKIPLILDGRFFVIEASLNDSNDSSVSVLNVSRVIHRSRVVIVLHRIFFYIAG